MDRNNGYSALIETADRLPVGGNDTMKLTRSSQRSTTQRSAATLPSPWTSSTSVSAIFTFLHSGFAWVALASTRALTSLRTLAGARVSPGTLAQPPQSSRQAAATAAQRADFCDLCTAPRAEFVRSSCSAVRH